MAESSPGPPDLAARIGERLDEMTVDLDAHCEYLAEVAASYAESWRDERVLEIQGWRDIMALAERTRSREFFLQAVAKALGVDL